MMPLQQLVKDNAVKKPAQAKAEQNTSGNRKVATFFGFHSASVSGQDELTLAPKEERPGGTRNKYQLTGKVTYNNQQQSKRNRLLFFSFRAGAADAMCFRDRTAPPSHLPVCLAGHWRR
jgi:hypothetical protein